MMIRATRVASAGRWTGQPVDRVTLDHDGRHRRRVAMTGASGLSFLLDLPEATALRDGDGLVLEDGGVIQVDAAAEPLAEIRARDAGTLIRIAWHLGNRHLPTQLGTGAILIRRDHVIEAMVSALGGEVRHIAAPFQPEPGAYAAHTHGSPEAHDHHHDDHHHAAQR